MIYGADAISPIEVGLPFPRHLHFNEISNNELRILEFDFLRRFPCKAYLISKKDDLDGKIPLHL